VEAVEAWLAGALGTRRHQRLVALLEEAQPIIRALKPESATAA
jgi:hypothetical protein